eukprot:TRINITY_DN37910_c0_g1_i7.p1 TRINITY_DN37910_c0_g1~~TRINITY_DN37910_c0_g1_i7.p1  ORF type:complete len:3325 (+),score=978.01 TRINITY_DN37910_c0_g1_i7:94-10068(+)
MPAAAAFPGSAAWLPPFSDAALRRYSGNDSLSATAYAWQKLGDRRADANVGSAPVRHGELCEAMAENVEDGVTTLANNAVMALQENHLAALFADTRTSGGKLRKAKSGFSDQSADDADGDDEDGGANLAAADKRGYKDFEALLRGEFKVPSAEVEPPHWRLQERPHKGRKNREMALHKLNIGDAFTPSSPSRARRATGKQEGSDEGGDVHGQGLPVQGSRRPSVVGGRRRSSIGRRFSHASGGEEHSSDGFEKAAGAGQYTHLSRDEVLRRRMAKRLKRFNQDMDEKRQKQKNLGDDAARARAAQDVLISIDKVLRMIDDATTSDEMKALVVRRRNSIQAGHQQEAHLEEGHLEAEFLQAVLEDQDVKKDVGRLLQYSEVEMMDRLNNKRALQQSVKASRDLHRMMYAPLNKIERRLLITARQTNNQIAQCCGDYEADYGQKIFDVQMTNAKMAAMASLGVTKIGRFRLMAGFQHSMKNTKEAKAAMKREGAVKRPKSGKATDEEEEDDPEGHRLKELEKAEKARREQREALLRADLEEVNRERAQEETDKILQAERARQKDDFVYRSISAEEVPDPKERVGIMVDMTVKLKKIIEEKTNPAQLGDLQRITTLIDNGETMLHGLVTKYEKVISQEKMVESILTDLIAKECSEDVDQMLTNGDVSKSVLQRFQTEEMAPIEVKAAVETSKMKRRRDKVQERMRTCIARMEREALGVSEKAATEMSRYFARGRELSSIEVSQVQTRAATYAKNVAQQAMEQSSLFDKIVAAIRHELNIASMRRSISGDEAHGGLDFTTIMAGWRAIKTGVQAKLGQLEGASIDKDGLIHSFKDFKVLGKIDVRKVPGGIPPGCLVDSVGNISSGGATLGNIPKLCTQALDEVVEQDEGPSLRDKVEQAFLQPPTDPDQRGSRKPSKSLGDALGPPVGRSTTSNASMLSPHQLAMAAAQRGHGRESHDASSHAQGAEKVHGALAVPRSSKLQMPGSTSHSRAESPLSPRSPSLLSPGLGKTKMRRQTRQEYQLLHENKDKADGIIAEIKDLVNPVSNPASRASSAGASVRDRTGRLFFRAQELEGSLNTLVDGVDAAVQGDEKGMEQLRETMHKLQIDEGLPGSLHSTMHLNIDESSGYPARQTSWGTLGGMSRQRSASTGSAGLPDVLEGAMYMQPVDAFIIQRKRQEVVDLQAQLAALQAEAEKAEAAARVANPAAAAQAKEAAVEAAIVSNRERSNSASSATSFVSVNQLGATHGSMRPSAVEEHTAPGMPTEAGKTSTASGGGSSKKSAKASKPGSRAVSRPASSIGSHVVENPATEVLSATGVSLSELVAVQEQVLKAEQQVLEELRAKVIEHDLTPSKTRTVDEILEDKEAVVAACAVAEMVMASTKDQAGGGDRTSAVAAAVADCLSNPEEAAKMLAKRKQSLGGAEEDAFLGFIDPGAFVKQTSVLGLLSNPARAAQLHELAALVGLGDGNAAMLENKATRYKAKKNLEKQLKEKKAKLQKAVKVLVSYVGKEEAISANIIPQSAVAMVQKGGAMSQNVAQKEASLKERRGSVDDPEAAEMKDLKEKLKGLDKLANFWSKRMEARKPVDEGKEDQEGTSNNEAEEGKSKKSRKNVQIKDRDGYNTESATSSATEGRDDTSGDDGSSAEDDKSSDGFGSSSSSTSTGESEDADKVYTNYFVTKKRDVSRRSIFQAPAKGGGKGAEGEEPASSKGTGKGKGLNMWRKLDKFMKPAETGKKSLLGPDYVPGKAGGRDGFLSLVRTISAQRQGEIGADVAASLLERRGSSSMAERRHNASGFSHLLGVDGEIKPGSLEDTLKAQKIHEAVHPGALAEVVSRGLAQTSKRLSSVALLSPGAGDGQNAVKQLRVKKEFTALDGRTLGKEDSEDEVETQDKEELSRQPSRRFTSRQTGSDGGSDRMRGHSKESESAEHYMSAEELETKLLKVLHIPVDGDEVLWKFCGELEEDKRKTLLIHARRIGKAPAAKKHVMLQAIAYDRTNNPLREGPHPEQFFHAAALVMKRCLNLEKQAVLNAKAEEEQEKANKESHVGDGQVTSKPSNGFAFINRLNAIKARLVAAAVNQATDTDDSANEPPAPQGMSSLFEDPPAEKAPAWATKPGGKAAAVKLKLLSSMVKRRRSSADINARMKEMTFPGEVLKGETLLGKGETHGPVRRHSAFGRQLVPLHEGGKELDDLLSEDEEHRSGSKGLAGSKVRRRSEDTAKELSKKQAHHWLMIREQVQKEKADLREKYDAARLELLGADDHSSSAFQGDSPNQASDLARRRNQEGNLLDASLQAMRGKRSSSYRSSQAYSRYRRKFDDSGVESDSTLADSRYRARIRRLRQGQAESDDEVLAKGGNKGRSGLDYMFDIEPVRGLEVNESKHELCSDGETSPTSGGTISRSTSFKKLQSLGSHAGLSERARSKRKNSKRSRSKRRRSQRVRIGPDGILIFGPRRSLEDDSSDEEEDERRASSLKATQNVKLSAGHVSVLKRIRDRINASSYASSGRVDWARLFRAIDKNGSGQIDRKEFKHAIRRVWKIPKTEVSDPQIGSLFDLLDIDESGEVEVTELVKFATSKELAKLAFGPLKVRHMNFVDMMDSFKEKPLQKNNYDLMRLPRTVKPWALEVEQVKRGFSLSTKSDGGIMKQVASEPALYREKKTGREMRRSQSVPAMSAESILRRTSKRSANRPSTLAFLKTFEVSGSRSKEALEDSHKEGKEDDKPEVSERLAKWTKWTEARLKKQLQEMQSSRGLQEMQMLQLGRNGSRADRASYKAVGRKLMQEAMQQSSLPAAKPGRSAFAPSIPHLQSHKDNPSRASHRSPSPWKQRPPQDSPAPGHTEPPPEFHIVISEVVQQAPSLSPAPGSKAPSRVPSREGGDFAAETKPPGSACGKEKKEEFQPAATLPVKIVKKKSWSTIELAKAVQGLNQQPEEPCPHQLVAPPVPKEAEEEERPIDKLKNDINASLKFLARKDASSGSRSPSPSPRRSARGVQQQKSSRRRGPSPSRLRSSSERQVFAPAPKRKAITYGTFGELRQVPHAPEAGRGATRPRPPEVSPRYPLPAPPAGGLRGLISAIQPGQPLHPHGFRTWSQLSSSEIGREGRARLNPFLAPLVPLPDPSSPSRSVSPHGSVSLLPPAAAAAAGATPRKASAFVSPRRLLPLQQTQQKAKPTLGVLSATKATASVDRRLEHAIRAQDSESSGAVDEVGFIKSLRSMKVPKEVLTDSQITQIFNVVDSEGNGNVPTDRLVALSRGRPAAGWKPNASAAAAAAGLAPENDGVQHEHSEMFDNKAALDALRKYKDSLSVNDLEGLVSKANSKATTSGNAPPAT